MSYCTEQELIDRYGEEELIQLTDRERTGAIDSGRLADAIAAASSIIDSRLGGRYRLPIHPVPLILKRIAIKLAWLALIDDANQMDDGLRRDRDALYRELDAIGDGRLSIGIAEGGGRPVGANTATVVSGGNVFNRKDKSFI